MNTTQNNKQCSTGDKQYAHMGSPSEVLCLGVIGTTAITQKVWDDKKLEQQQAKQS